jgi:hypothetical protein
MIVELTCACFVFRNAGGKRTENKPVRALWRQIAYVPFHMDIGTFEYHCYICYTGVAAAMHPGTVADQRLNLDVYRDVGYATSGNIRAEYTVAVESGSSPEFLRSTPVNSGSLCQAFSVTCRGTSFECPVHGTCTSRGRRHLWLASGFWLPASACIPFHPALGALFEFGLTARLGR